MAGTGRELTISHGAQFPAQCLLGDDDAEFLKDPLAEVDDPPAHDAMHGRDRAALEYRGERDAVRAVQTRRLSGRLAINQPFRPLGVELITQSRTIWSVTPPTFAASVRLAPS